MSNSEINSFIENEDLLLSCTFSDQSDFPYLTEQSSCSLNPSSFLSIQQNEAKEIKDEIDFNIFDILQQQDPDIARVLESVASENPVLLPQLSENSTNLILQDDTKTEPNQIVSLAESDDREIIEMKNLNPVTLTPSMPIPSRVSMRLIKKKKTFADEIYEEPKRPRGKNNKVLRLNKRKISIDDDEELYKKNLDENSTDDFFENLYDEDSCSMYSYDSKMGYKMRKRIDSKDFDPIKKESNKEAATRYRIKKSNERDSLFQTKVNLEKDNDKIRQKIELVQIEISYLKNMLVQTLLNKGVLKEGTQIS